MRPRGTPPTPSAMSIDSAPVGIADTPTRAASSPRRISEPWPNSRSICVTAAFSAAPLVPSGPEPLPFLSSALTRAARPFFASPLLLSASIFSSPVSCVYGHAVVTSEN